MDIYARPIAFISITLLLIFWEHFAPRKKQTVARAQRWPNNFGLGLFNIIVMRLVFSGAAVATALWTTDKQWGILNAWNGPAWVKALIAIVLLDLMIYWQHRLFHKLPWFWRLHRVHHTDLELDVSSGVRFHPLEAVVSMGFKILTIICLGASANTVLFFELGLNLLAMFNHSNIYIPQWIETRLRKILITPDIHRIHHSIIFSEQQHNFGFSVPWWDQVFGSFQLHAKAAPDQITLGDGELTAPEDTQTLSAMLIHIPFRSFNNSQPQKGLK